VLVIDIFVIVLGRMELHTDHEFTGMDANPNSNQKFRYDDDDALFLLSPCSVKQSGSAIASHFPDMTENHR
jgi:hypothetical protein